jgi:hypothetical protein
VNAFNAISLLIVEGLAELLESEVFSSSQNEIALNAFTIAKTRSINMDSQAIDSSEDIMIARRRTSQCQLLQLVIYPMKLLTRLKIFRRKTSHLLHSVKRFIRSNSGIGL